MYNLLKGFQGPILYVIARWCSARSGFRALSSICAHPKDQSGDKSAYEAPKVYNPSPERRGFGFRVQDFSKFRVSTSKHKQECQALLPVAGGTFDNLASKVLENEPKQDLSPQMSKGPRA